jgi:hypothetical protein
MNNNSTLFYIEPKLVQSKQFLICLIVFISLFSITIIIFVFYIFAKHKNILKSSVNYFMLNLIIVDFMKAIISIPFIAYSFDTILNRNIFEYFNNIEVNILCNSNIFLTCFFETIQLISFAAISFERLRMVKSPLIAINVRIKLTKKLLIATWSTATLLWFILFLTISTVSGFKNLNFQNNECFVDIFQIYVFGLFQNTTSEVYKTKIDIMAHQNIIYDSYNLLITIMVLFFSIYNYVKISLFLKHHKIEMENKFHMSIFLFLIFNLNIFLIIN